jgi:hypothetical protein
MIRWASCRLSTVGTRWGRLGRAARIDSLNSFPSACGQRNSSALKAWFWVDAATICSTARSVRKASIPRSPIAWGCRLWWNRI